MSRIEITFFLSISVLLVSIPVIRWANAYTKAQTITTRILEREYVKQRGVKVDVPTGTKYGTGTSGVRVELPPHWSVTVRIDGERRRIIVPPEERELAQLERLQVTYRYLRTGEFRILDVSQPDEP